MIDFPLEGQRLSREQFHEIERLAKIGHFFEECIIPLFKVAIEQGGPIRFSNDFVKNFLKEMEEF